MVNRGSEDSMLGNIHLLNGVLGNVEQKLTMKTALPRPFTISFTSSQIKLQHRIAQDLTLEGKPDFRFNHMKPCR